MKKKMKALPTTKARTAYALLSAVRRLILAEPRRYDQGTWLSRRDEEYWAPERGYPACGTVGCVAGWVTQLTVGPIVNGVGEVAQRQLGITSVQASELFDGGALGALQQNPQTKRYAEAGAKHIRDFQRRFAAQLKAKTITYPKHKED